MIRKFTLATALLLTASASAMAADLPSRRPPPVFAPVPIFTWTGFYVGADIGYAWGYNNATNVLTGATSFSKPNGEIGGLHAGYNYQISQFVLGIEGDVMGSDFNNSVTVGPYYQSSRVGVEGSIRGRAGVAWDRALFYVTGGAAFGSIMQNYALAGIYDYAGTLYKTRVGYTVGGGVEYALSNNWSVRGEYRYTDYGRSSDSYLYGPAVTAGVTSNRVVEHRVTVGFSYKFDMYAPPSPVVAKY